MTIALVAASHGTSVPEARVAITALVEAVREASPHLDVREAFVDVEEPRVDHVVATIGGLSVVVPLLLSPGFHVRVDIENAVDTATAVAARTLGPDPLLTDILLGRLMRCDATPDDVIVLGAAGSTDSRSHRSVDIAARMLGAAWGAPVPVGYVGGTGLPIAEVVRDVARSGRRVVIVSYLMAPGFFFEQLNNAGADLITRPLLDGTTVDPDMVSLVLDRFAEAAELLDWSTAVGEM